MNKLVLIMLVITLCVGTCTFSLWAKPAPLPQEGSAIQENTGVTDLSQTDEEPPNYFLKGLIFLAGILLVWILFYYLIYPALLRYYSHGYSKKIFWSLVLLYSVSWICLSIYVFFEVGFYIEWLKYVFAFIGGLWLIWFIVIMASKDKTYY